MNNGPHDPIGPLSPDDELDEELQQHLELLTARFVSEGMTPEAARTAARERFGDTASVRAEVAPIARGIARRQRAGVFAREFAQDAVFALRTLRRAPLFTGIAVATLAVAIAANTAMFSVVRTVLLRPLPYANAERTHWLVNSYPGTGMLAAAISPAEFTDLEEQLQTFDGLAGLRPQAMGIAGDCGGDGSDAACEPMRAAGYVVSPNIFSLLGAQPVIGRAFTAADGAADAPRVTVISHALWLQRFGGDSTIIGRTILAAGIARTVIGVMPRGVRFPDVPIGYLQEPADLWVPYTWSRSREEGRGNQYLVVLGRAREGASPEQHRADLDLIGARFKERFPERYTGPSQWRLAVSTLRTAMVGEVRPALLILWGIVGLVLLIACANVANLLLARGASRETEVALRAALGAGRGRIVRQLLTEALLLGAGAGTIGIALGLAALSAVRLLAPPSLPQVANVAADGTVLLVALGAALGASLLCGLVPALQLAGSDLQSTLRSGSRGGGGPRSGRLLRRALVVSEVALTLVVLVSAGLLLRSFTAAQRREPEFDANNVLTFELALPRASYAGDTAQLAFHNALVTRLGEIPGVQSVSAAFPLPLDGGRWSGSWYAEGRMPGPNDEYPNAHYSVILPRYFETMAIPLLGGREFTAADDADAMPVVVVSHTLAAKTWPGEDAVGKRINDFDLPDGKFALVVGVAPDVRRLGVTDDAAPQIYLPQMQHVERRTSYVIRTAAAPLTFAQQARDAVHALDPSLPVAKLTDLEALVARSVAPQRFNAGLLVAFAVIALALASGGLFGVVSYLVTLRDHELGVRLALGGRPTQVVRLIVGDGMRMALAGIVLGLIGAWYAGRAMEGMLFGVTRGDPFTYAAVALLLAVVCFAASWLPARRATRIDPASVLRGG